jgi:hypothetical protein
MTNKYMFDESSHALHRVVGYAHTWEQIAPGVRVRRRVVRAEAPLERNGVASWVSTFSADFEGFVTER